MGRGGGVCPGVAFLVLHSVLYDSLFAVFE